MFAHALAAALCCTALAAAVGGYEHVLLISVDGLHSLDVDLYSALKPDSTIASFFQKGVVYKNASTSKPSDSFPGLMAQITGAHSKTHGVWYDVGYSRDLVAADDTKCTSTPGTQVAYDESIDVDMNMLFTTIDPTKLPKDPKTCTPVYPHMFLKVNTIFEVIHEAGLTTAWSDKHPAYDIVNGPSGKGCDYLFTPEINSMTPDMNGDAYTDNSYWTTYYDSIKVAQVNKWLQNTTDIPAILGMNFQTVSVAEKGGGGELNGIPAYGFAADGLILLEPMVEALDFVDAALGSFFDSIDASGITDTTLVIVSAKHGQSPMDASKLMKIDDGNVTDIITAAVASEPSSIIADDVALIWLHDASTTQTIVDALNANKALLNFDSLIYGADLKTQGFTNTDVQHDDRVPDIIIVSHPGVIYTTSTSKLSEHGGFAHDDTNVALMLMGTNLNPMISEDEVETKQIAVTILDALDLDSTQLQGAVAEGTQSLPGI